MQTEESLKYPVGRFQYVAIAAELRPGLIAELGKAPEFLNKAVSGLTKEQLLQSYRPGGWTLAQVVHHIVESDVNAYPRLKYALTKDVPEVMVADQELWSKLPDAKSTDIGSSLALFEAIRSRWAVAFKSLSDEAYSRKWRHSRYGELTIDFLLQQYVWYAKHHTAQIVGCRERMG